MCNKLIYIWQISFFLFSCFNIYIHVLYNYSYEMGIFNYNQNTKGKAECFVTTVCPVWISAYISYSKTYMQIRKYLEWNKVPFWKNTLYWTFNILSNWDFLRQTRGLYKTSTRSSSSSAKEEKKKITSNKHASRIFPVLREFLFVFI